MKPATPLPWKVSGTDYVTNDRHVVIPAQGLDSDDQAYIVHAANAYPRLVEALRNCINAVDNDDWESIGAGIALLRGLGELK